MPISPCNVNGIHWYTCKVYMSLLVVLIIIFMIIMKIIIVSIKTVNSKIMLIFLIDKNNWILNYYNGNEGKFALNSAIVFKITIFYSQKLAGMKRSHKRARLSRQNTCCYGS